MSKEMKDALEQKIDEQMPEKVKTQAELYDEEIAKLKKSLEEETDVEKLKTDLENLNAEITAYEGELSKKVYKLPTETKFRGTVYSRPKVYEFIVDILSTSEVAWQAVLSMFEFIDWWKRAQKDNVEGIPYQYYDTTLRFLGQVKYKGYENMKKILVVNSILANIRDEYTLDLSKYYYLHGKFDAIANRIDAIKALNEPLDSQSKKTPVK